MGLKEAPIKAIRIGPRFLRHVKSGHGAAWSGPGRTYAPREKKKKEKKKTKKKEERETKRGAHPVAALEAG
jgi:hypothetical protein